jgi:phospholipid N-methyltransferase
MECPLQKKSICDDEKMEFPRASLWADLKNSWFFLRESLFSKDTVGAILPSSHFLAQEIVSVIPIDFVATKRRILEIGPGTGVFTEHIVSRMNPRDTLDLVEFDEKFCQQLREKYIHHENVRVFHTSILDYTVQQHERYQYVISGLPLNSFSLPMVWGMFLKFRELTVDGGMLSYFEYLILADIKRFCLAGKAREHFNELLELKKTFYCKHGEMMKNVLRNVPPARVLHHRLNGTIL